MLLVGGYMDIIKLCSKINLQPEVRNQVIAFSDDYNFSRVNTQLENFFIYEKMKEARTELQNILGEDKDNIKILACMLKASADAYEIYKIKDISDEIYYSTMKCYTRFINETYKMTGKYYFDRYWWTTRQAGCHLFRIGELEYEIKPISNKTVIEIHIPSDADFSPFAVDKSLQKSRSFFAEFYPFLVNSEYRCHSWLLDYQLKEMLPESSNIIRFQKRFDIFDKGEEDTEFIEWLFKTKSKNFEDFSENTSLQRNMKKHLLSGGIVRNAYGRLR